VFILSADLGQAVDYTAISIVEQIQAVGSSAGTGYLLRYLHRPPLGTTYPAIVGQVWRLSSLAETQPEGGAERNCWWLPLGSAPLPPAGCVNSRRVDRN
jgi:hypothetical protein